MMDKKDLKNSQDQKKEEEIFFPPLRKNHYEKLNKAFDEYLENQSKNQKKDDL